MNFLSLMTLLSYDCPTPRKYAKHNQQREVLRFSMGLIETYNEIRAKLHEEFFTHYQWSIFSCESTETQRGVASGENNSNTTAFAPTNPN